MTNDPLVPYLLEIATQPEAEGMILTGGFGMRIKQKDLKSRAVRTLIADLPEARATTDLDIVLSLDFWLNEQKGVQLRALLDRLGYTVAAHNWQFRKPYTDDPDRYVKIDLQATLPEPDQKIKTRNESRFGDGTRQVGIRMGTGIGALASPEGFALQASGVAVPIVYGDKTATILVPHPYAWLNLKIRAAHDWLREQRGEIASTANAETGDSKRLKHVFDVYVLVAMLTEEELNEAADLARRYADHIEANKIRTEATELFGNTQAPAITASRSYARRHGANDIDYELFWETLQSAIGIR